MSCPSESELQDFVDGKLDIEAAKQLEIHLDCCSACRKVLAFAARESIEDGRSVGRYRIVRVLGGGGMGVVYEAYDPDLDRRVALKVLRRRGLHVAAPQTQLVAEAQAMAKLAHPNVVAIYDVGTFADQVFVAMELVEGETFGVWLARKTHSRRQLFATLLQAGAGVAAAHAAGLVHRDLKPENILVGTDGRTRVSDFGLARPSDRSIVDDELAGTPAYMALEQVRGHAATPQTDQFSFAVVVYEALFGSRPFHGETLDELAAAIERGPGPWPGTGIRVSRRVKTALARALAAKPSDRYPTLQSLLDALRADRGRMQAIVVSMTAVALATVTAATIISRSGAQEPAPSSPCAADPTLHGVWTAESKAAIAARFRATKAPFAEDAWQAVSRQFDRFSKDWAAMATDTCEATRVRGTQSEAMHDLRMRCLDEQLDAARILAAQFAKANIGVVENAAAAADHLSGVTDCGSQTPETEKPWPTDPLLLTRIREVRNGLDLAKTLDELGQGLAEREAAQAAVALAHAIGYPPVEAEALEALGWAYQDLGDRALAETNYKAAITLAEQHNYDYIAARASVDMIFLVGYLDDRYAEAAKYVDAAKTTLQRMGNPDPLVVDLLDNEGVVALAQGRSNEALALHTRALDLFEKHAGNGDSYRGAVILDHLAMVFDDEGKLAQALHTHERAAKIIEKAVGPHHPALAQELCNEGYALAAMGRDADALAGFQRAVTILEPLEGDRSDRIQLARIDIAAELVELGRLDDAESAFRKLAAGGPLPARLAAIKLQGLASLARERGHLDQAIGFHQQSISVLEKELGAQHPELAASLSLLGDDLLDQGNAARALRVDERALALVDPESPHSPIAEHLLTAIGEAHLMLHDSSALDPLQRARAIYLADAYAPRDVARNAFALARALWGSGGDRVQARELAETARQTYIQLGLNSPEAANVTAWLARTREAPH